MMNQKKNLFATLSLLITVFTCISSKSVTAQTVGDVLLNVDYENGTTNSGITGLNPTNATASDAAYMVSPGATGDYAVAHKIVYGDSQYYSNENWRSESDAQQILAARYYPGLERRYEFSVLLKDWPIWNQGDPINESNLFQLKVSGGENVPLMIRAQRNAVRIRYQDVSVKDVITNLQPYVNQWIHFRIDVLWANTPTGYMRTYMKMPGQTDYVLVDEKTNYTSYTGDGTFGEHGYIKWGLYVVPPNTTRIAYHEDIRIIALNPQNEVVSLWSNPLEAVSGRLSNTNPYTDGDIKNENISVSGIGFSAATLNPTGSNSDRYLVNGWNGSTTNDGTEYFSFTLTPNGQRKVNFSSLTFGYIRGSTSPPIYALRANIKTDGTADDFTTDIGSATVTATNSSATIDLSAYKNITVPITFRLYWYGGGTGGVSVSNFNFQGAIADLSLPVVFNNTSAKFLGETLLINWMTASETNNSYFEIQASNDGKNFVTIRTIKSKNGNADTAQSYEAVISRADITNMLALPMIIGILGFTHFKKRKEMIWVTSFVLLIIACISCSKYERTLLSRGEKETYIRIKQVDVNGNASYSKAIAAVNSN